MADKPLKTLYHRELREISPISVTVKSERQQSKHSKPNDPKPDYVTLIVNGAERYYVVENEACAQFFTGQRGRTFTICAEGSREEAAITYVGGSAATLPHQQPAQRHDSNPPGRPGGGPEQPAPRTAAHPGQSQEYDRQPGPAAAVPPPRDDVHEAEVFVARRLAGQKITLRAALALAGEFQDASGMVLPWDVVLSINSTLFIAGDRAGMWDALPMGIKFSMPKKA